MCSFEAVQKTSSIFNKEEAKNLSLTQSQEEEIKLITCRLSMLSLTQSQEEVEKEDEHNMDWSYDSSMDWSYDFEY